MQTVKTFERLQALYLANTAIGDKGLAELKVTRRLADAECREHKGDRGRGREVRRRDAEPAKRETMIFDAGQAGRKPPGEPQLVTSEGSCGSAAMARRSQRHAITSSREAGPRGRASHRSV